MLYRVLLSAGGVRICRLRKPAIQAEDRTGGAENSIDNLPQSKREGIPIERVIAEASVDLRLTLNQIKLLGVETVYPTHLEKLQRLHKAALTRTLDIDRQLGRTGLYEVVKGMVVEGRRVEGAGEILTVLKTSTPQ